MLCQLHVTAVNCTRLFNVWKSICTVKFHRLLWWSPSLATARMSSSLSSVSNYFFFLYLFLSPMSAGWHSWSMPLDVAFSHSASRRQKYQLIFTAWRYASTVYTMAQCLLARLHTWRASVEFVCVYVCVSLTGTSTLQHDRFWWNVITRTLLWSSLAATIMVQIGRRRRRSSGAFRTGGIRNWGCNQPTGLFVCLSVRSWSFSKWLNVKVKQTRWHSRRGLVLWW